MSFHKVLYRAKKQVYRKVLELAVIYLHLFFDMKTGGRLQKENSFRPTGASLSERGYDAASGIKNGKSSSCLLDLPFLLLLGDD